MKNPVVIGSELDGVAGGCIGSDENWNDGNCVASLVKILEIQCVVPYLVDSSPVKGFFPDLELHSKHDGPNEQNGVDATPHARNTEF